MSFKSKLLCFLVLALFLVSTVSMAGELEGVKVGTGKLKIGGVLQVQLFATNWDNNINVAQRYTTFRMTRARFLMWGTIVPDRVKYFVQCDFNGSPALLDYKMILANYIPNTSVSIGRFLPYWSLYMWRPVSNLELINYPIVVSQFAMWRQMGLQTATKMDAFSVYLGCFNGADIPNNRTDNNNAKDFFARLDVHPAMENMELLVGGQFWMGRHPVFGQTYNKNNTSFGGFLSLDYNKMFFFRGEYDMKTWEEGTIDPTTGELIDLTAAGFYATAGYCATEWLDIIARYDSYDPDTDCDDDAQSAITFGGNLKIKKHNAQIGLNLVKNTEEWKVFDNQGEEIDLDNDEIIMQFQIAF